MFKHFCCKFCILLGAIWRYNPRYNPQHKCSKTRGGSKAVWTMLKKNRRFGSGEENRSFFYHNFFQNWSIFTAPLEIIFHPKLLPKTWPQFNHECRLGNPVAGIWFLCWPAQTVGPVIKLRMTKSVDLMTKMVKRWPSLFSPCKTCCLQPGPSGITS